MTEAQVGFLYKAASSLQPHKNNPNLTLLRSYYLMRCNTITKGYGLPDKHFSSKVRCARCCVEWKKGTETTLKPIELSKKQRQRIRRKKVTKENKVLVQKRKELLQSNDLEQICTFCKSITVTTIPKPEKIKINRKESRNASIDNKSNIIKEKTELIHTEMAKTKAKEIIKQDKTAKTKAKEIIKQDKIARTKAKEIIKQGNKKIEEVNVYKQTKDAFSLKSSKNIISSAIKEQAKVVKINKKKKNKFAGLCEKAVLASAKLKQKSEKKNKLNLFLKPSS